MTRSSDPGPPPRARAVSRRKALQLLIGLVVLLAGGILLERFRDWRGRRLWAWHRPGPPADRPPDRQTLDALTAFVVTLHGHDLTSEDDRILRSRLSDAALLDSGWRREFRRAASYLDGRSRARHGRPFASASPGERAAMTREVMEVEPSSLRSELLALVSDRERARRMIRRSLVRRLAWIYRHSEATWRRRGSPGWPRAPHGRRAYTGPASVTPC